MTVILTVELKLQIGKVSKQAYMCFVFVSCIIHHSTLWCIVTNMVFNTTMPSSGNVLKNVWYSMAANDIVKQYKVIMLNKNEPISIV